MTCAARCSIALIAVARRRQAEESRFVAARPWSLPCWRGCLGGHEQERRKVGRLRHGFI